MIENEEVDDWLLDLFKTYKIGEERGFLPGEYENERWNLLKENNPIFADLSIS